MSKEVCPWDGKELTRYGRADWRCPDHGNVMVELVLIADAMDDTRRIMAQTKQPPTNKEPKPSGELREESNE